jgi:RNA polymerase sigma factor (sigma-70 family)
VDVGVPDAELVARAAHGAPAAFGELVTRHGPAVHAYLARRTGRRDADDLLGDVWLRAWESRAGYDRRWPDARPWLYGIARNTLRAHWRRSSRPTAALPVAVTDPWADADSRLDAASQRGALLGALEALSDDDREVLLLVTWEHLTPAEVALVLGVPQGTVRSRLHRSRRLVREAFESPADTLARTWSKEA